MYKYILIACFLGSIFVGGFYAGKQYSEYNHAIDKVQAVDRTIKQERAKQDAKDKELAEANKRITELQSLNERVQCSPNTDSRDLQSCERERVRLRNLTKRCSSIITRYIEGTDKLLIERK